MRGHPDGIDYLIANAGIADSHHKSAIETCALLSARYVPTFQRRQITTRHLSHSSAGHGHARGAQHFTFWPMP